MKVSVGDDFIRKTNKIDLLFICTFTNKMEYIYNLRSRFITDAVENVTLPTIKVQKADTMQTMTPDAHTKFLREPINVELTTIPYIGKVGREALVSAGIDTSWKLIGKFLMFNRDVDMMVEWVGSLSPLASHKRAITKAIAEKVAIMFGDEF